MSASVGARVGLCVALPAPKARAWTLVTSGGVSLARTFAQARRESIMLAVEEELESEVESRMVDVSVFEAARKEVTWVRCAA